MSFGLPFSPLVLKRAQQFFLLAIDRDGRRLLLLKLLTQGRDMPKLLIAVGMRSTFQRFLVNLERIALLVEHLGQRRLLDAMPLPGERLD